MAKTNKREIQTTTVTSPMRLTIDELALFKQYAADNQVNRSQIMNKIVRELITQKPHLVGAEMIDFRSAVRQLSGIANNLNQLTRAVNSGERPIKMDNLDYFKTIHSEIKTLKSRLTKLILATKYRWVGF